MQIMEREVFLVVDGNDPKENKEKCPVCLVSPTFSFIVFSDGNEHLKLFNRCENKYLCTSFPIFY